MTDLGLIPKSLRMWKKKDFNKRCGSATCEPRIMRDILEDYFSSSDKPLAFAFRKRRARLKKKNYN